jgi:hypothetical protein
LLGRAAGPPAPGRPAASGTLTYKVSPPR